MGKYYWWGAPVALGLIAFGCFALLDQYGALDEHVAPFTACIGELAPKQIQIFGLWVPVLAQQTFVFALLATILLASAVYCRRQVANIEQFIKASPKWSRAGRGPESLKGLMNSVSNRVQRWWHESKAPITLLGRVVFAGFLVPFGVFVIYGILFAWLFPSVPTPIDGSLVANPACQATGRDVPMFVWEHFWRGAALNLPDAVGWPADQAHSAKQTIQANAFIGTMRLFMTFAGSVSLIQLCYALFLRQVRSLWEILKIPFTRFFRRTFRRAVKAPSAA